MQEIQGSGKKNSLEIIMVLHMVSKKYIPLYFSVFILFFYFNCKKLIFQEKLNWEVNPGPPEILMKPLMRIISKKYIFQHHFSKRFFL